MKGIRMATRAESETIIRWDRSEDRIDLFTADRSEARHWERLGYVVTVHGRTTEGVARSWSATAPMGAVRLRRVANGQIVKRAAPQHAYRSSKPAA